MKRIVQVSALFAAMLLAAPLLVKGIEVQPSPHRIDVTA